MLWHSMHIAFEPILVDHIIYKQFVSHTEHDVCANFHKFVETPFISSQILSFSHLYQISPILFKRKTGSVGEI